MTVIPYFIKGYRGFDEEKFINGCWRKFVDIRKEFNLNEEQLQKATGKSGFSELAGQILEGYTRKGIVDIYKREGWKLVDDTGYPFWEISFGYIPVKDPTETKIENMSRMYSRKCRKFKRKIDEMNSCEATIKKNEEQADAGDVRAMLFMAKAYREGNVLPKNTEKAQFYYQRAKEAWAGEMSQRYREWLDNKVLNSGMERIAYLGKIYIDGCLEEAARKSHDVKLRREMRWLEEQAKSGDGWAAFTLGNIFYYGYGHWGCKRKKAHEYYLKAAEYKEGIYALELEEQAASAGDGGEKNAATMFDVEKQKCTALAVDWEAYMTEAHDLRKQGKYKEAREMYLAMLDENPYKASCMYWTGMMYKMGQGVYKDAQKAEKWLQKAALYDNQPGA